MSKEKNLVLGSHRFETGPVFHSDGAANRQGQAAGLAPGGRDAGAAVAEGRPVSDRAGAVQGQRTADQEMERGVSELGNGAEGGTA